MHPSRWNRGRIDEYCLLPSGRIAFRSWLGKEKIFDEDASDTLIVESSATLALKWLSEVEEHQKKIASSIQADERWRARSAAAAEEEAKAGIVWANFEKLALH